MLLQDAGSVYETDQTSHVISALEQFSGRRYADGGDAVRSFRVLCDHGRGMTAIATDGVTPSNEGRGYVLRRILRRAVLHGSRLGLETPFLGALHDVVIESTLADGYPELGRASRRRSPPDRGRGGALLADACDGAPRRLDELMRRAREGGAEAARRRHFELHDTYGFPVELTAEIARERGLGIDLEGFEGHMQAQRERARAAARAAAIASTTSASRASRARRRRSEFVGYDEIEVETEVLAVEPVAEGLALVKLARSPFYPEGGGQVSDGGEISAHAVRGQVESVYRLEGDQALLVRLDGELRAGDTVHARVDVERRRPTMANHTGTHLLQRALRNRLGEHVRQAGSAVRPEGLRFDFTHPAPLTADELRAVEDEVNRVVLEDHQVRVFETLQDEARALGATALFGEKYGDIVRVVDIDGYSMELCGGTHVRSTAAVGPFAIVRESSVGQGVRRHRGDHRPEALRRLRRATAWSRRRRPRSERPPEQLPEAVRRWSERVRELGEGGARAAAVEWGGPDLRADRRRGRARAAQGASRGSARGHARDALVELADRLRGCLDPSAVVLGMRRRGARAAGRDHDARGGRGRSRSAVVGSRPSGRIGRRRGGRPAMARAGGRTRGAPTRRSTPRAVHALGVTRSPVSARAVALESTARRLFSGPTGVGVTRPEHQQGGDSRCSTAAKKPL